MSIWSTIKGWFTSEAKESAGDIADKAAAKVHERFDPPKKDKGKKKGGK